MRFGEALYILAGLAAFAGVALGFYSVPEGFDAFPPEIRAEIIKLAATWIAAGAFGAVCLAWMGRILNDTGETNRLLLELVRRTAPSKGSERR